MSLIGYAPKMCLGSTMHVAKRDTTYPHQYIWRCTKCDRAWDTAGTEWP